MNTVTHVFFSCTCGADDVAKIAFMRQAVADGDRCFGKATVADAEVKETLQWISSHSVQEVRCFTVTVALHCNAHLDRPMPSERGSSRRSNMLADK